MRDQAQAEARRVTEAAQSQLAADRQQALAALRQEVGALAVDLAGKIVGESLADQAAQGRLVPPVPRRPAPAAGCGRRDSGHRGTVMRGASRASLTDAKYRLATMAAGPARPSELGADLFSVVGLLDAEPPLALADSSSARDARAGLVSGLLGSRVSADAVELVSSLATSPWSSPADLVDAIEELAEPLPS